MEMLLVELIPQRNGKRLTSLPKVNRCVYDLTPKPPATIEYV
jgi:GMP synthase PP-ATPase subunit